MRTIDLVGKTFERLKVLERAERPAAVKNRYVYWLCKCKCGAMVVVNGKSLRRGWQKSCGCLRRENAREQGYRNVGRKMVENNAEHGSNDLREL